MKIIGQNDVFNWAKEVPKEKEEEVVEDPIQALLQSNTSIFQHDSTMFKANKLDFQKLVNANNGHEHQSVVTSLNFHPSENILMTSGLDRKVKLFQVTHDETLLSAEGAYNNVNSS